MTVARRIGHNMLWLTAGKVVTIFCALLTMALITRHLGPGGYGIFRSVQAYLAFAQLLAHLGIATIVAREISRPGADQAVILGNALGLRIASAVLILGPAALLAYLLPYDATIRTGILVGVAGFVALSCFQTLSGVFQQRLQPLGQVAAEVTGAVVLLVAAWLLVLADAPPLPFVAAMTVAFIAQFFTAWWAANRLVRVRIRFDPGSWWKLLSAALPLAAANVLILFYYRADTLILSFFHPASVVGHYGVATKVLDTVVGFAIMFTGLILPLLSGSADRPERFEAYFRNAFEVLMIGVCGVALLFLLFAEPIATLIAGARFAASATPLRIFAATTALVSLSLLLRHALTALDLQARLLPGFAAAAVTATLAYLLLIPPFGAVGAAAGTAVGEFTVVVWALLLLERRVRVTPDFPTLGRILAAAGMAGMAGYGLLSVALPWMVTALLVGILYGAALLLFRAVRLDALFDTLGIRSAPAWLLAWGARPTAGRAQQKGSGS